MNRTKKEILRTRKGEGIPGLKELGHQEIDLFGLELKRTSSAAGAITSTACHTGATILASRRA